MEKSKVHKIIKEEVAIFLENFEYNDSKKLKNYKPTDVMKKNASLALSSIEKNDLTQSGGNEGSGIRKANNIVNGEDMNHGMLKRMKAFFDNNIEKYNSEKSVGKNINNSGIIQTWNLWGGDAGKAFAEQQIGSLNDLNKKRKKVRRDISVGNGTGNVKRLIDTNYHRKK